MKQIEDFYRTYTEKIKEYKKSLNKDFIIYLGLNHNGNLEIDDFYGNFQLYIPDHDVNVRYCVTNYSVMGSVKFFEDSMICEPGNLDKICAFILANSETVFPGYNKIIKRYRNLLEGIYKGFLKSYEKTITSISDIERRESFIKGSIPSLERIKTFNLKYKSIDFNNDMILWNDGSFKTYLSQAIRGNEIEETLDLVNTLDFLYMRKTKT